MLQSPIFWVVLASLTVVVRFLPRNARLATIALASAGYLAYIDSFSVIALASVALGLWYVVPRAGRSGVWGTLAGVVVVVGFLAWFKYVPPLVMSLSGNWVEASLILPLGISYYSFKLLHWVIEVRRGNLKDQTLEAFLAWLFLFPAFAAGPIERFDHFRANLEDRLTREAAVDGLSRIIYGLVKKLLVADLVLLPMLGTADGFLAELPAASGLDAWRFLILAFLYGYMDFAGYSDIAIGASRLLGIRVAENFDWPIFATDIASFWKRWHMTLAGWCQAYVYMPLIGLTRNPWLAIYATFLTMGLWHAGNLNWVMWGLYHGTGMAVFVAWTRFKRRRKWRVKGIWAYRGVPVTFLFVAGGNAFTATHGHGGYAALRLAAKALFIDLPA